MDSWGMDKWADFLGIVANVIAVAGALWAGAWTIPRNASAERNANPPASRQALTDFALQRCPDQIIRLARTAYGKYLAYAGVAVFILFVLWHGLGALISPNPSESVVAVDRLKQAIGFVGGECSERSTSSGKKFQFALSSRVLERAQPGFRTECERNYRDWFDLDETRPLKSVCFEVRQYWNSYTLCEIKVTFVAKDDPSKTSYFSRTMHFSAKETAAWANALAVGFEKNGFRSYPVVQTSTVE